MAAEQKVRPLYSSRADDPALSEAIDGFVVGLAERVDSLQDADARAELGRLAELARDLASRSLETGFELLAESARAVASGALAGKAEDAHQGLVELTEIARAVRMGHRGAL